jgi:hypothetical protein
MTEVGRIVELGQSSPEPKKPFDPFAKIFLTQVATDKQFREYLVTAIEGLCLRVEELECLSKEKK